MMRTTMLSRVAALGNKPFVTPRRVFITGMGAVTPLARNVEDTWKRVCLGETATTCIKNTPEFIPPSFEEGHADAVFAALPARVAAPVQLTEEEKKNPKSHAFKQNTREPRYQKLCDYAVEQALKDAGLFGEIKDPKAKVPVNLPMGVGLERVAISVSSGISPTNDFTDVSMALYPSHNGKAEFGKISPFFIPKVLINIVAGNIAIKYGFKGPNHATVTACATGTHCIGDAMKWIEEGICDIAICGATEGSINPTCIAGFSRMKALSTKYNDNPSVASRPFDKNRDGFVMGEGSGIVILEAEEVARKRMEAGTLKKIYAEVRGYGMSGDGHHISSPAPDGNGAQRAIEAALLHGGIDRREVGYVNAHATSTPMGDEIELKAITRAMREGVEGVAPCLVSSSKGSMGHLLGAAGAVEAIIAIKALETQIAPPTANLTDPSEHDASKVNLITKATPLHPDSPYVMSNSFGFGGTNASVLFTPAPKL